MPGIHDTPGVIATLTKAVPAAATAVTALTVIGKAPPYATKVVGAYFIPDTTQAVAASNNRQLDVTNLGQAGAGTATPATVTYTAAISGTAAVAKSLTVSATAATVALAANDVIGVVANVNGTGLPLAAGTIVVELQGA